MLKNFWNKLFGTKNQSEIKPIRYNVTVTFFDDNLNPSTEKYEFVYFNEAFMHWVSINQSNRFNLCVSLNNSTPDNTVTTLHVKYIVADFYRRRQSTVCFSKVNWQKEGF